MSSWMVRLLILLIGMMLGSLIIVIQNIEAAPPAPPTVTPCQLVNTATLAGGGMIEVFRCEAENTTPYLLDSYGFMKNAD
jgi:hypothetical protein